MWGKVASTHINKINILQKKIVRIVNGVPPRTHSSPLFDRLKIMTIYQIHNYYIGVFMYKLYHKQLPPMFDMFEQTTYVHNYAIRHMTLSISNMSKR